MIFTIKAWVKQVVLGAGIVAVLCLFPLGYKYGVDAEKARNSEKYTQGLESLIESYSSTQTLLNSIAQGQQVTLSLMRTKQSEVTKGVQEYNKTEPSNVKCLDDSWVQLYNQSIEAPIKSGARIKADGESRAQKDADKGSK